MFRANAPPNGACENLVCALKLLAQSSSWGGDSFVQVPVEDLQERSRLKMMDEHRRFIAAENHVAGNTGHLEKDSVVVLVVEPKFNKKLPRSNSP